MKKLFYIFLIAFLFNSPKSNANCNFKEANYIKELSTPNKIKGININIPRSRDYIINFVRSLTSKSKNIPPNLRKKFNANLEVNYEFGRCEYKAKIWQNGDWKDHLEFKNGMPLRSLNVKLKKLNAGPSSAYVDRGWFDLKTRRKVTPCLSVQFNVNKFV